MILLSSIFAFKIDESKATILTATTDLWNSNGWVVRVAATASDEDINNIGYWLYSYDVTNISDPDGIHGFEINNPFNYNIEVVSSPQYWYFDSSMGSYKWNTLYSNPWGIPNNPISEGENLTFKMRTQQGYPGLVWAEARDGVDCIGTTLAPVPEPATMLLLGPALLGLVGLKKKRS